jgi:hypothetical protein
VEVVGVAEAVRLSQKPSVEEEEEEPPTAMSLMKEQEERLAL